MGLSNYPPSVSGFEPEINGQDEKEFDFEQDCGYCGEHAILQDQLMYEEAGQWVSEWTCPRCEYENTHTEELNG